MSYTELDSILGQPVPQYVVNQLHIRSNKTLNRKDEFEQDIPRDDASLVFTANRSAWIRVISSVDIKDDSQSTINLLGRPYKNSELAKSFVLFGGTSAYAGNRDLVDPITGESTKAPNYQLTPYFTEDPQQTEYQEYGLRPIAGITSAKITTQGRLGSILMAEIDFKVNTKRQLDIVDILYFKLGYTMFIEWGSTFFFKQKSPSSPTLETYEKLFKSEDYAVDPFEQNMDSEKLRIKIAQSIRKTDGNYDAMVGIVTNFNFVSNTDGGFDCKIKVMGPGMLAESMRTNAIPALPQIYEDSINNIAKLITNVNKNREEKAAQKIRDQQLSILKTEEDKVKSDPNNENAYPSCVRRLLSAGIFETKANASGVVEAVDKNQVSGAFKAYRFNKDGTYTLGSSKPAKYACDPADRIIDPAKKPENQVLRLGSKAQPFTAQEFVTAISKGDLPKDRFEQSQKLADVKNRQDESKFKQLVYALYIKDTQPTPNVEYYYVYRFQKLLNLALKNQASINIRNSSAPKGTVFGLPNDEALLDVLRGREDNSRYPSGFSGGGANVPLFLNKYDKGGGLLSKQNRTSYVISYRKAFTSYNQRYSLIIQYDNEGYTGDSIKSEVDTINEEANRKSIEEAIQQYMSNPNNIYDIQFNTEYVDGGPGTPFAVLSAKISPELYYEAKNTDFRNTEKFVPAVGPRTLNFYITAFDPELISGVIPAPLSEFIEIQPAPSSTPASAVEQAAASPLEFSFESIKATDLQNSEAAMYKSQLEAVLRTIQIMTISQFIDGEKSLGEIKEVSYINWPKQKREQLYAILQDGALGKGVLKDVLENSASLLTEDNISKYYADLDTKTRYLINLYCGFHRGLMKDNGQDDKVLRELVKPNSEYKINFEEILRSYVVPYHQKKSLVDGSNIHYPTYVTMGFFFMILNHCGFIYNTTEQGLNIPIVYLDFNQGSNIMLSSDFMLSANPYRFIVPFSGNFEAYKKLFDDSVLTSHKKSGEKEFIIKTEKDGNDTPLWTGDALSKHLPPFKFEPKEGSANPYTNYRGKLMNVLVSIDYLLDVIRTHATRDESNSVYFRSLIEEILTDMSKALGNYNVFRLAYDDPANCFYVVDDQTIPGLNVLDSGKKEDILSSMPQDLPIFGKNSIAKSFTIQTENSTKLGNVLAIGANSDVKNQTTAGVDATSFGNSSLYAIDRYKKSVTVANDNVNNKKSIDKKKEDPEAMRAAIAATRFNESIKAFYGGGSKSEDAVEQATNYYIERVAKARNSDTDTEIKATMLLPLSVNFSTDGVSGLGIYQAFTIPEQLLPYSYTVAGGGYNQSATKRVGFIVTGLDHTIQGNMWTTDVRGNMYYVKNKDNYRVKPGKQSNIAWTAIQPEATGQGGVQVPGSIQAPNIQRGGAEGRGWPLMQSDVNFAKKYTGGVLPALQYSDGSYVISSKDGKRAYLTQNPQYITQLRDVLVPLATGTKTLQVHITFEGPLKQALAEIASRGLNKYIQTTAGALVIRNVTDGVRLSNHAWGMAIDFNENRYPFGTNFNTSNNTIKNPEGTIRNFDDFDFGYYEVSKVMKKYGIGWLSSTDPMHFSINES